MLRITFAKNCAWRAVYLTNEYREGAYTFSRQLFCFGVDPSPSKPEIFIQLTPSSGCRHYELPRITWSAVRKHSWLLPVYNLQQSILHGLDGRRGGLLK